MRRGAQLPVMAVGMIADPQQAEDILAAGRADMVALARGLLDNPRWVWHAAERFGVKLDYPPQYRRGASGPVAGRATGAAQCSGGVIRLAPDALM